MLWLDRVLPFDQSGLLQVNLLHLAPGAEQPRFLKHEGEGFIFVLDGTLDIIITDEPYPVSTGGGIYFASTLDHRYAYSGDQMVRGSREG